MECVSLKTFVLSIHYKYPFALIICVREMSDRRMIEIKVMGLLRFLCFLGFIILF